jgi:3-oxoacyl-[acyl-carrier protein] reductase
MNVADQSRRVAVVTGGAGGLGEAVCARLARDGLHVVVCDLDATRAAAVAADIVASGHGATARACDVTSTEAFEELVSDIEASVGPISVLANLAGAVRNATLAKVTDEDLDLVLRTHVNATVTTTRAVAGPMKSRGTGRIINTSSVAVRGTVAGVSYSAAKGAIEALTRSTALELGRSNITVNCVEPGVVATGMFLSTPADFQQGQIDRIPLGRAAGPDEIAGCFAFLAGADASYVTGQVITACGGLSVGALR